MRLYWPNVVRRMPIPRRRHRRPIHILQMWKQHSQRAATAIIMPTAPPPAPKIPQMVVRASRRSRPGCMRSFKGYWQAKRDALIAKQSAARMSISSICKWMSIKTQVLHIACDASAIRKHCAAIINSNVIIAAIIRRPRSECVSKNCQWYCHCTWNASSTWNNTIATSRCRTAWCSHWNWDYSIRSVHTGLEPPLIS